MLATELKRPARSTSTKILGCRVRLKDLEPIQHIADVLFEGNFSLLMRTALDTYITQILESGELTTN